MDNLLLQRFVDGRLSVDELQRLAQDAEARPQLWRVLGAAVIEEQLWQRSLTNDSSSGANQPTPRTLNFINEINSQETSVSHSEIAGIAQARTVEYRGRPQANWRSFMMVACSLLAMPLVFWMGMIANPGSPTSELAKGPESPEPKPFYSEDFMRVPAQANPVATPPIRNADRTIPKIETPFSFQFSNNEQIQSTPLLPETMAREIGYRPVASEFSPELQNRFRRDGYQLQSQIYFLQGKIPDGREIIVPIESVNLAAFGQ